MSNQAYEATQDDVENVLRSNETIHEIANDQAWEKLAEKAFKDLDFDLIEQAALYGDDLDEQTDYANDEIARQLREMRILAPLTPADTPSGETSQRQH